ncbi:hypothetical protein E1H99_12860 [Enterococcus hirae]|nr:hypothetical protein E1H99_12860 [Enterococcus hirae]
MPVTSGSPAIHFLLSVRKKKTTTLNLNKTDLFVAVKGKEERWYALKQLDSEGGYRFYRVNQDPLLYLKFGLFDQKNRWKNGYKKEGNEIRIGDKLFTFSTHVNRSKKLSHGIETAPFIEVLSRKHSDQLYQQLYDSGNDKADLKKAWEVAKHFIPFYDCVTGIINQDTEEAVVSCTIDALLMIPVLGQITSLNMKFALGVARAFARGGIRNVIKSRSRFLPNIDEIRRLVLTFAQNLDPGFGMVVDGGRLVVQKLVKFKNELRVGKKMKEMLERVETMEKAKEAWKKSIEMVDWNGLEVPVRKVNDQLYMRVTNLKTAEVFGGLFMKKGNRLEAYRPATFTTEQLKLINLLEAKLDKDQVFVVEVNSNPQAYGTGEITTVEKEGEETKRFIRMKEKLIEVTMTAIKEHGIRLDVYAPHLSKSFPVNFNGIEWFFEATTSPFVAKEVEKKIASMLDKFETHKNPSELSAPDGKGLMRDESGRSYIKISDHYIPLITLEKNGNRYHLVKKDYNESMTILRFDEKNGKFRFETDLERNQAIEAIFFEEAIISKRRSKGVPRKRISRVSDEETPGTSQGVASQMDGNIGLPPINQLPSNPPGNSKQWTKLREAIDYQEAFIKPKYEDDNVQLGEFSAFLPEKTPIYCNDNEWLKGKFMKCILEDLPSNPKLDFRVYIGLNSDDVPESIKLFRKKLVKNFTKAQETCKTVKEKCGNLLKEAVLAETPEGQYLINLFKLDGLDEQEVILKEIIMRLWSIAKKGEAFLQQTADLAFKNIWIVSTDLIRQPGSQEYRSLYRERIKTEAFVQKLDPECRILIFADAFHLDPSIKEGFQIRPDEHETILHEMTHHVAVSEDIVGYNIIKAGFRRSGEDVINNFISKYPDLLKSLPFKKFVNHLAYSLNKPTISMITVATALEKNPTLRANFQMMDAEMLMTLLRDFADGRPFDERPIVKRSINEEDLGIDSMFTHLAVMSMLGEEVFEKDLQLNKTQEQISTRITDNTSTEVPGIVRTANWTETTEPTQILSNRSSIDLVTTKTDRGAPQPITNNSFLNLVINSKERSTQVTPAATSNQPINKNQKEPVPQH